MQHMTLLTTAMLSLRSIGCLTSPPVAMWVMALCLTQTAMTYIENYSTKSCSTTYLLPQKFYTSTSSQLLIILRRITLSMLY